jgi:anti-sigma regulatory factor (Ser/Thr protein kinase)
VVVPEPMRLTLPGTPDALRVLAEAITAFAVRQALTHDTSAAVHLALEEVVTNILVHGYGGRPGGSIDVTVVVGPGEVVARVEDSAPPFDPRQAPAPDFVSPLEQRRPGGLGLFLVQRLMDGIDYERVGDRNRLTLRKALPAVAGAAEND